MVKKAIASAQRVPCATLIVISAPILIRLKYIRTTSPTMARHSSVVLRMSPMIALYSRIMVQSLPPNATFRSESYSSGFMPSAIRSRSAMSRLEESMSVVPRLGQTIMTPRLPSALVK